MGTAATRDRRSTSIMRTLLSEGLGRVLKPARAAVHVHANHLAHAYPGKLNFKPSMEDFNLAIILRNLEIFSRGHLKHFKWDNTFSVFHFVFLARNTLFKTRKILGIGKITGHKMFAQFSFYRSNEGRLSVEFLEDAKCLLAIFLQFL